LCDDDGWFDDEPEFWHEEALYDLSAGDDSVEPGSDDAAVGEELYDLLDADGVTALLVREPDAPWSGFRDGEVDLDSRSCVQQGSPSSERMSDPCATRWSRSQDRQRDVFSSSWKVPALGENARFRAPLIDYGCHERSGAPGDP
jgi:hypothetical protein